MNNPKSDIAVGLALLLCLPDLGLAQTKTSKEDRNGNQPTYRLEWRDLPPLVRDRKLRLELRDGTRLEGQALAVSEQDLRLDVRKTSGKKAWPKGQASVPRSAVARIRINKTTSHWRAIGAGVGAGVGMPVAAGLAEYGANEGAKVAAAVALAVLVPSSIGYLLGWAADRKSVTVVFEPEEGAK